MNSGKSLWSTEEITLDQLTEPFCQRFSLRRTYINRWKKNGVNSIKLIMPLPGNDLPLTCALIDVREHDGKILFERWDARRSPSQIAPIPQEAFAAITAYYWLEGSSYRRDAYYLDADNCPCSLRPERPEHPWPTMVQRMGQAELLQAVRPMSTTTLEISNNQAPPTPLRPSLD